MHTGSTAMAIEIAVLQAENARLRAVLLNIHALAERGFPINNDKLAVHCKHALAFQPQTAREK